MNCEECGTYFVYKSNKRFCSKKCKNRFNRPKARRTCITCKVVFTRKGHPTNYCSFECRPLVSCLYCNKSFKYEPKDSNRRFCNRACFALHRAKYKEDLKLVCKECGKKFLYKREKMYCTTTCAARANGKKNMKRYQEDPAANVYSMRWAVLEKMRPDLKELMIKIENRITLEFQK